MLEGLGNARSMRAERGRGKELYRIAVFRLQCGAGGPARMEGKVSVTAH